jgi:hypothetical protein
MLFRPSLGLQFWKEGTKEIIVAHVGFGEHFSVNFGLSSWAELEFS